MSDKVMNREGMVGLLRGAVGTYRLCRCYFSYGLNCWFFYLFGLSEELMLGAQEDDFLLDGFQIRRLSDLRCVEEEEYLCARINEVNGLLSDVEKPPIDLSSWKNVFESLKQMGLMIIVENEYEKGGFFRLGYIDDVKPSHIVFTAYDADGQRTDNMLIFYDNISSVTFGDRYSVTWHKYLSARSERGENG